MVSKKNRRHSGWVSSKSTINDSKQNIINECLEPQLYYDTWVESRDGFRDYGIDYKKICRRPENLIVNCQCDRCSKIIHMNNSF